MPRTVPMAKRRNLVILRAGDSSLHEAWLAGAGERNWDLIVNYFGDDPARFRQDDVRRIDSKGPKWPALHDLIQELGQEVFDYDRVWMPDDDLRATKDGINLFFDVAEKYTLMLSQPALTLDSHLGHYVTLHNRSFVLRFTNFVECMAPCFSRDFLKQMLPTFNANISGWGLDYIWATKIADWTRMAIVDAVTVCHTRPVGGPNYVHVASVGKTAQQEMSEVLAKYGIAKIDHPFIRGGINKSGQRLSIYDSTGRDLIDNIVFGYLPEFGQHAQALMGLLRPNLNALCNGTNAGMPAALKAS